MLRFWTTQKPGTRSFAQRYEVIAWLTGMFLSTQSKRGLTRRSCGDLPLSNTRIHRPRHQPVSVCLAVVVERHVEWRDGTVGDRVDRVAFRRALLGSARRIFPAGRTSRLGIPRAARESTFLFPRQC